MKVLHLITSLKVGGAESLLVDLLQELQFKGIKNYVLYFHEGPNSKKIKELSIDCIHIQGFIKMYDPVFLFNLFKCIKRINPDCIHTSLWSANILGTIIAKLLGIPIIASIHLASNLEQKTQNSIFRSLLDKIYFKADKIIAVSNSTRNDLIKLYPDLKDKLGVILNGIKSDEILPVRKQNGEKFIIATVGRFILRKNHKLLIKAFYELKKNLLVKNDATQIELHLVGQGPLEPELKSLVKELEIQDYVKFIKTDNARKLYRNFDCFVLPSEQEGLSISLLEAMSAGLPVVVVGQNGLHEVVASRETGIVSSSDINSLCMAIESIIKDEDLRISISSNAKRQVKGKYSLENMAQKYLDIYNSFITF